MTTGYLLQLHVNKALKTFMHVGNVWVSHKNRKSSVDENKEIHTFQVWMSGVSTDDSQLVVDMFKEHALSLWESYNPDAELHLVRISAHYNFDAISNEFECAQYEAFFTVVTKRDYIFKFE